MPSIVLVFLSVCFFYSFYDYYLFTCFSMAINYFCDLNSALSLSVQNTRIRKTPFLLWAGHVTPCHNWIDKDEFTPWVILYQYNFSSSDQLDISLVQYDTHLFLVIFPLALQFSQIFIFRSHRDNFIKFLKIITVSFFLVNNSRQFCTKYFLQSKA